MALKMFSQVQTAQTAVQPAQAAVQPLRQGEYVHQNVSPPHRRPQSSMAGFNF
jgi:hypothetical protein